MNSDNRKRCLVTGGAGFIGSHIVDRLLAEGHTPIVLDNLSTGKRENLPGGVTLYEQDLLDSLEPLFEKEKPGYVFHQAAQVSVSASVRIPEEDARVNVLGTVHLLEACRQYGVQRVMYASTAASYGASTDLPYREDGQTLGISPYGVSKYMAERYLYYYRYQFGLSFAALRYANVYGPRQDPHGEAGVVAIFSQKLLAGEPCSIFGDGGQTCDFVYVKDIAEANVMAMNADLDSEEYPAFNASSAQRTSVNDLYAIINEQTGAGLAPIYQPPRPGDPYDSCLDNAKIQRAIGWRPRTDLRDGLRDTVDFFRKRREG